MTRNSDFVVRRRCSWLVANAAKVKTSATSSLTCLERIEYKYPDSMIAKTLNIYTASDKQDLSDSSLFEIGIAKMDESSAL